MKILYVTTIGGTMTFFMTLIQALLKDGKVVDIAANITQSDVPSCYHEWGCKVYPLSCSRTPLDCDNLKTIKELRKILTEDTYDIVHCHTPIAAMCTRIACHPFRQKGLKVVYTAHGFHFYKGAPLKSWLLYYPIEWLCAYWTDMLITINGEDYARAKRHMHARRVEYVPGVGVDIKKFSPDNDNVDVKKRKELRLSLGIGADEKMLLSVGELNLNKNHIFVIRALEKLNNPKIHYVIAGEGALKADIRNIAEELGVGKNVHLLGFRDDVAQLYKCADIYILPSKREGLNVSLMEAIASRTPVICTNIRGNKDLVSKAALFTLGDVDALAEKIVEYLAGSHELEAEENYERLKICDVEAIAYKMKLLYCEGDD